LLEAAEFAPRGVRRFFRVHASLNIFLDKEVQV